MTHDERIEPELAEILEKHVESEHDEAAFTQAFAAATTQAQGRRAGRTASWALAAAAVLTVGVASASLVPDVAWFQASGSGAVAPVTEPWEEPFQLRFAVDPPEADARRSTRRAMVEGVSSGAWADAEAATSAAGQGALRLRRAQVALIASDYDAVSEHGRASGTPAGALLAAEIHIVDLEVDAAKALLEGIAGPPAVAAVAQSYRALYAEGSAVTQGLAEVAALANVGDVDLACDHLAEVRWDASPTALELAFTAAPGLRTCPDASPPNEPSRQRTSPNDAQLRIDAGGLLTRVECSTTRVESDQTLFLRTTIDEPPLECSVAVAHWRYVLPLSPGYTTCRLQPQEDGTRPPLSCRTDPRPDMDGPLTLVPQPAPAPEPAGAWRVEVTNPGVRMRVRCDERVGEGVGTASLALPFTPKRCWVQVDDGDGSMRSSLMLVLHPEGSDRVCRVRGQTLTCEERT